MLKTVKSAIPVGRIALLDEAMLVTSIVREISCLTKYLTNLNNISSINFSLCSLAQFQNERNRSITIPFPLERHIESRHIVIIKAVMKV